jgi:hypothetical protein
MTDEERTRNAFAAKAQLPGTRARISPDAALAAWDAHRTKCQYPDPKVCVGVGHEAMVLWQVRTAHR